MELAAAQRKWDALHEEDVFHDGTRTSWVKERDAAHNYHYNDGVRLWVADVDHQSGETWLSVRESASGLQDQVDDEGGDG